MTEDAHPCANLQAFSKHWFNYLTARFRKEYHSFLKIPIGRVNCSEVNSVMIFPFKTDDLPPLAKYACHQDPGYERIHLDCGKDEGTKRLKSACTYLTEAKPMAISAELWDDLMPGKVLFESLLVDTPRAYISQRALDNIKEAVVAELGKKRVTAKSAFRDQLLAFFDNERYFVTGGRDFKAETFYVAPVFLSEWPVYVLLFRFESIEELRALSLNTLMTLCSDIQAAFTRGTSITDFVKEVVLPAARDTVEEGKEFSIAELKTLSFDSWSSWYHNVPGITMRESGMMAGRQEELVRCLDYDDTLLNWIRLKNLFSETSFFTKPIHDLDPARHGELARKILKRLDSEWNVGENEQTKLLYNYIRNALSELDANKFGVLKLLFCYTNEDDGKAKRQKFAAFSICIYLKLLGVPVACKCEECEQCDKPELQVCRTKGISPYGVEFCDGVPNGWHMLCDVGAISLNVKALLSDVMIEAIACDSKRFECMVRYRFKDIYRRTGDANKYLLTKIKDHMRSQDAIESFGGSRGLTVKIVKGEDAVLYWHIAVIPGDVQ